MLEAMFFPASWLAMSALAIVPAPDQKAQPQDSATAEQFLASDPALLVARRRKRRPPNNTPPTAPNAGTQWKPKGKVAPPPPLKESRGRRVVALLPFQTVEIPDELQHSIENALLTELDEARGLTGVAPKDVTNELEPIKNALGGTTNPEVCLGDAACLSFMARYARAHYALETRVSGVGGTIKISLRYIDATTSREIARVARVVEDQEELRAKTLHRMAVELFRPSSYVGTLVVETEKPGADVYLNDEYQGPTPLRKKGLKAGPYILRVSQEGHNDVYQFVDVQYRRASTYEINLGATEIASVLVEAESDAGFGTVWVYSPEGEFELRVDGEPRGAVPGEPLTRIPAGMRRITLRGNGAKPLVEEVEVQKQKRTDIFVAKQKDGSYRIRAVEIVDLNAPAPAERNLALRDPADDPSPVEHSEELGWRFTSGLVVAGVGVVALGTGAYYGNVVRSLNAEAKQLVKAAEADPFAPDDPRLARAEEINEEGPAAQKRQFVGLGVGGALVAAGAGLVLWDLMRVAPTETTTTVDDGSTGGGAHSATRWRPWFAPFGTTPTLGASFRF